MKQLSYTFRSILLLSLFALYACNEDKGNYDYIDPNNVKISGLGLGDTTFTVEADKTLKLSPTLEFSVGEEYDSFTYQWMVLSRPGKKERVVVSTERVLDIPLEIGATIYRAGKYNMVYTVKNKNTGVSYFKKFDLLVKNRMASGYVALCETENNFDINIIADYNDTLTMHTNMLDLYSSQLPRNDRKPIDIVTFSDILAPYVTDKDQARIKYAVYILTDKSTDKIKTEDYSYIPEYNISSVIQANSSFLPGNTVAKHIQSDNISARNAYMYTNGHWFLYNVYMSTYYFSRPINKIRNVDDSYYKPAPYIATNIPNGALLFDETNNRFMYQALPMFDYYNSEPILSTIVLPDNPGDIFDFNNPNYRLLFMGTIKKMVNAEGFAIVKNVLTNQHELLKFGFEPASMKKLLKQVFPAGSNIETAKYIIYHPSLPYLYFASEDKVYRLLVDDNMEIKDITSSVLTPGHKISVFKYIYPRDNRESIAIATYDPSGPKGKNGKLEFYYSKDGTGELILDKQPRNAPNKDGYQIDMSWSGMGKIVGVDYKEK